MLHSSSSVARPSRASAGIVKTTLNLGATLVALASCGLAAAEPSPALDRASISVGGFYAEPELHVGGDTRYGRVDTPDEKIDDVTLPRVKAEFLFGDSQGLSFDYFRYDKHYNPTVSGSTEVNGLPVSGTARLDGKLQLDLAQLAYKWWIGQGADVFGIGVGGAYLHAKVGGTASGTLEGLPAYANGIELSGSGSASTSGYAPLLELGWKHAFNDQWRMYADASGVKKNGGKLEGHVYGGAIGVEWFPAKNVGVVLDYGIQKIKLERNADRTADLNVRLTGPSAYVKFRF
ncbi:hypothetical protein IP91_00893 [Pseudoduganella lurida]|uniref:Uncharacterized protein n=1 Tax=Pseudoduganella lurida TaxID=1036180 RepID=A0A562RN19_9BURK|nr:hypothetical protein [Pseudoduganella lurida]TWI69820.1 hypothetical protein IP91_00893 [Pseudoduganella lurida]